jgi:hypothetical protein
MLSELCNTTRIKQSEGKFLKKKSTRDKSKLLHCYGLPTWTDFVNTKVSNLG